MYDQSPWKRQIIYAFFYFLFIIERYLSLESYVFSPLYLLSRSVCGASCCWGGGARVPTRDSSGLRGSPLFPTSSPRSRAGLQPHLHTLLLLETCCSEVHGRRSARWRGGAVLYVASRVPVFMKTHLSRAPEWRNTTYADTNTIDNTSRDTFNLTRSHDQRVKLVSSQPGNH